MRGPMLVLACFCVVALCVPLPEAHPLTHIAQPFASILLVASLLFAWIGE